MKPTIGRIVHYRANGKWEAANGAETHPAIVTRVWSETCVNLETDEGAG